MRLPELAACLAARANPGLVTSGDELSFPLARSARRGTKNVDIHESQAVLELPSQVELSR
jgi:hypothetical protein